MFRNSQFVALAAIAALAPAPARAAPMNGKQFTDIFNTAIQGPVSQCLVPAQATLLGPDSLLAACQAAVNQAESQAVRSSDPATSGVYRMIEYFSLTGVAGAMTKIDGMRSRRTCQAVMRRSAVMRSIDLDLYDAETANQLAAAFTRAAELQALCQREFSGL